MPEQPHDMAEQSREAFIYIFGYRGLDLPLEKDMPAPEAPPLAELFDRWTRECLCWQVLPTSAGSIVVRTLTASNRIKNKNYSRLQSHNLQLALS